MSNEAITAQALHISQRGSKNNPGERQKSWPVGHPWLRPCVSTAAGQSWERHPLPCLGKPKHPFSCHPKFTLAASSGAVGQKEDRGLRLK